MGRRHARRHRDHACRPSISSWACRALSVGHRLIDTALTYDNQPAIARAVRAAGISRESLFLSTKVPGGLGTEGTVAAHEENLRQLNMTSVDLLLTHLPCGFPVTPGPDPNCSKAARQATWRGLEAIYKSGKARAIGVAHFCQRHMQDVLEVATVPISVARDEWHVGMGADPLGLKSFCASHNISFQSSSSLCGNCGASRTELISGPLVSSIGAAHNATGAQVALRWLVQSGSPVTPASASAKHLAQDLDIFRFALTASEMERLSDATSPPSQEFPSICKLA